MSISMLVEKAMPLSDNPLFDDWLQAVEDYRNRDAEEKIAETHAAYSMAIFVHNR